MTDHRLPPDRRAPPSDILRSPLLAQTALDRQQAVLAASQARAAAQAAGPVVIRASWAEALAMRQGLTQGQIVEVQQDETRGGARSRYRLSGEELRFLTRLDGPRYRDAESFFASEELWPEGTRIEAITGEIWDVTPPDRATLQHPQTGMGLRPRADKAGEIALSAAPALIYGDAEQRLQGFQAVLDAAGTVRLPAGQYGLSDYLRLRSGTRLVFDPGAVLMPARPGAGMLRVEGAPPERFVPLAADALRGQSRIRLAEAVDWQPGDWIELRSEAPLAGTNHMRDRVAQILRLVARQGDDCQLDRALLYDFARDQQAVAGRAQMCENVVIDGARLNSLAAVGDSNGDGDAGPRISFGLYMRYVANFRLVNPQVFHSKPPGGGDGKPGVSLIRLSQCLDGVIEDPVLGHGSWYGLSFGGFNDGIRVEGGRAWDVRHAVSVVWGSGPGSLSDRGESWNLSVRGMQGNDCTHTIFDTHDTGQQILFEDCVASGSRKDSGFQIRNLGTRLIRPRSFANHLDGVVCRMNGLVANQIIDPDLQDNGRNGISCTGGNLDLRGGVITGNGAYAIMVGGGRISGTRLAGGADLRRSVIQIAPAEGVPPPVPCRIESVTARPRGSRDVFLQIAPSLLSDLSLRDCDLSGFAGRALQIAGGAAARAVSPRLLPLGGSRISSVTARRDGVVTLAEEERVLLDFGEALRADPGVLLQPEVQLQLLDGAGQGGLPQISGLDPQGRGVWILAGPGQAGRYAWQLLS